MPMTFDPTEATEKKEFTPIPEGKYFTHISKYKDPVSLVTAQNKDCDILKLELTIDGKSHPDYADRKLFADVFITKSVDGKDPASSDNKTFYYFLDAISYPLDSEEAEINGTTKKVLMLPRGANELFSDHIVGKPIIVSTKKHSYTNKDGETVETSKVTYYEKWEGKEKANVPEEDSDLPF